MKFSQHGERLLTAIPELGYSKDYDSLIASDPETISLSLAENPFWYRRAYRALLGSPAIDADAGLFPALAAASGSSELAEVLGLLHGVDSETLILQCGLLPAIGTALSALTRPGDALLVHVPLYTGFLKVCERQLGLELHPLPLDAGPDDYRRCGRAAGPRLRGVLLCHPHNPSGKVFSERELRHVLDFCAEEALFVLSDEAYRLTSPAPPAPSLAALAACSEFARAAAVVVWGLAKDFGACGARLACLHVRDHVLRQRVHVRAAAAAPSAVAEALMLHLLRSLAPARLAALAEENQREMGVKRALLEERGAPLLHPGGGGFFVCLRLPGVRSWEEERRLQERLVWEKRVLLTPGESMRAPEPGIFRLCFSECTLEKLSEAIDRMEEFF